MTGFDWLDPKSPNPQFILNMVCNLMGYDISGCKIAARTHLTLHRRKELCIEKGLVLWRTIKRSSRGRSPATSRLCAAFKQNQNRGIIGFSDLLSENISPNLFGIGKSDGDKLGGAFILRCNL